MERSGGAGQPITGRIWVTKTTYFPFKIENKTSRDSKSQQHQQTVISDIRLCALNKNSASINTLSLIRDLKITKSLSFTFTKLHFLINAVVSLKYENSSFNLLHYPASINTYFSKAPMQKTNSNCRF